MPTPIKPEAFIARGASAEQAQAMAAEHNSMAGIRADSSPASPFTPAAPRPVAPPSLPAGMTADQARTEIDSIRARRSSGEIDDRAWRKQYEPRILELSGTAQSLKDYRAASGADKSTMIAEMDAGQTQAAFEASVDAMEPVKSPSDYIMPSEATTPEAIKVDSDMRQAMFQAGIPREMGNNLATEVEATARALQGDDAQVLEYMDRQEATLRRMFGTQYDARIELARSFLSEQSAKSPTLATLLANKPQLFGSWQVVRALSQIAESRRRSKANG